MMRVSKPIDGLELELEVKTMEKIVQDYKTEEQLIQILKREYEEKSNEIVKSILEKLLSAKQK